MKHLNIHSFIVCTEYSLARDDKMVYFVSKQITAQLWSSDTIWWQIWIHIGSGNYLNQCWLVTIGVLWNSHENNFTRMGSCTKIVILFIFFFSLTVITLFVIIIIIITVVPSYVTCFSIRESTQREDGSVAISDIPKKIILNSHLLKPCLP